MMKLREKMIKDLEDLIASCDTTIVATASREGDFRSILVKADEKMRETSL